MPNPNDESQSRWHTLAQRLEERASHDGMGEIVALFRDSLRPLAPLLAQLLWVAQPTMSLFGERDSTASLALLLESDEATDSVFSQGTPTAEGR